MTGAELQSLLPILILALGATMLLMIGAWWPARRPLMLLGMAIAVATAVTAWQHLPQLPEVAGMFSTGPYARFFTSLWSLLVALTLLLSSRYGEERRFPPGEYTCLVMFAGAGMSLLSSATSLVGVLLGLESFTLVLYILIAIDKQSLRGAEAGLKYLVMGLVATGFLAFGMALIYASCGTLHIPEALQQVGAGGAELRPVGLLGWGMLICAVGFKVSLVPFHLWTPDVYQGVPAPVGALLSTGSKGAVFAVLLTLLSSLATIGQFLIPIVWILAAVSMLVGTLSALRQDNLKRMLAYSSVVHMGYLLNGVLAGGPSGRSAVLFYIVAYAAANLGAFAIITSFAIQGEEAQNYRDLRGLGYLHPRRSSILAFFLLSLAGIPPTGGFLAKFGVFRAAIEADYLVLTLVGVLASLISLYYYLRPVIVLFMSKERAVCLHPGHTTEFAVLALCLTATLVLGIYPEPLLALIHAVLG